MNTVSSALAGTFAYAGQVCTATRRIILSERIKDRFLTQFEQAVGTLKVGDPMDRTTSVGPVINVRSLQKIDDLVKDASGKGAKIRMGGSRMSYGELAQGNYYAPTILDGVVGGMGIAQTEVFGPVSAIMEAANDDEAIEMANNTIYGLGLHLHLRPGEGHQGREEGQGRRCDDQRPDKPAWDNAPFGGIKRSGMGREGVSLAISELTEVKFIVANIAE